jgi:YHS domain-containing protein
MVIDPVCGMSVDEKSPDILKFSSQYGGQTFNFCSQKCKDAFEQAPETYARRSA